MELNKTKRTIKKFSFHYDRFEIFCRMVGDMSENVLLCVNGAQQTMGAYLPFLDRFPGYSFVLFDFPGQGSSSIVSGEWRVTLDEQIAIMKAVLDFFAISKTDLFAFSWGAIVASSFITIYPEMLGKIMLMSYTSKPNTKLRGLIDEGLVRRKSGGKKVEIAETIIKGFGGNLHASFHDRMLKQFSELTDQATKIFQEHNEFVKSVEDFSIGLHLEKVTSEVLFGIGEKDSIIDLNETIKIAKKIPMSSVIVFKNIDHFMHFENSDIIMVYEAFLYGNKLSELNKNGLDFYLPYQSCVSVN